MSERDCQWADDQLVDYSDGALSEEQRCLVDEHVSGCASCRRQLELLEESLQLAQQFWTEAASEPTLSSDRIGQPKHRLALLVSVAAGIAILASVFWFAQPNPGAPDVASDSKNKSNVLIDDKEQAAELNMTDIVALLRNESRAARLAVSAELLAGSPSLEQSTKRADSYIATNFADSLAGRRAMQRLGIADSNSNSEDK